MADANVSASVKASKTIHGINKNFRAWAEAASVCEGGV